MESEFLKHYSIKPKTEKLFELTDLNENSLGQLEIVSSNKKQSLIRCGNKIYEIYCESEWKTNIYVKSASIDIAKIDFSWTGKSTLNLLGDNPIIYFIERISIWESNFKIINENNQLLYFIIQKYDWKSMKYQFEISYHPLFETYDNKELIFLISVYFLLLQSSYLDSIVTSFY
jgi:hypothetical protein